MGLWRAIADSSTWVHNEKVENKNNLSCIGGVPDVDDQREVTGGGKQDYRSGAKGSRSGKYETGRLVLVRARDPGNTS